MKINLSQLESLNKKCLLFLRQHLKLILLGLLLLFFLYSLLLFYYYAYLPLRSQPEGIKEKVAINQTLYQKVMGVLDSRSAKIEQGLNKEYPDVFK